jgi:hypothetical protein
MTEFTYIHNKLSKDYTPTDEDILCGRGKACGKHPGNNKFSAAIRANLQKYGEAPKRVDKSNVVVLVVRSLRENGGRFIKQDKRTKQYHELSDGQAHGKTGHAIRDLLKYNNGPSSSTSQLDNSVLSDSDISERLFHAFDDEDSRVPGNAIRDLQKYNNGPSSSTSRLVDNSVLSDSDISKIRFHAFDDEDDRVHGNAILDLQKYNNGPSPSISRLYSSVLPDSDISESLFNVFDDEKDTKATDIHLKDKCFNGTPRLVTPGLFASSSFSYDDFEREFENSF